MAEPGVPVHNVLFAQLLWTTSHKSACSLETWVFSWWDTSPIYGGLLSACRFIFKAEELLDRCNGKTCRVDGV